MNTDDLKQTINKSIQELGFARIARPALIDVFSTGKPASFDIYDELKDFAEKNNFEIQNDEDEDFVVFSPLSGKSSEAAS
jgi:hypothetical protein